MDPVPVDYEPMQPSSSIRRMQESDIPSILKLEKADISCLDPWARADYLLRVATRTAFVNTSDESGEPVAFLIMERRPTYLLLSRLKSSFPAALDPLMTWACILAVDTNMPIRCPVRESNLPDQLLLKEWGFRYLRTIANWFNFPPEAAYLFSRDQGG